MQKCPAGFVFVLEQPIDGHNQTAENRRMISTRHDPAKIAKLPCAENLTNPTISTPSELGELLAGFR
jgi:hypothetical protein